MHWKKVDTNVCNLCNKEKQSILRLLFQCEIVRPVWIRLQAKFWNSELECNFNEETVIFNECHEDAKHIINTITLICK